MHAKTLAAITLAATTALTNLPAHADPAFDQNGVRTLRALMRDDARGFAYSTKSAHLSHFDWSKAGMEEAVKDVKVQDMRAAFAANQIGAERQFDKIPNIVTGTLNSVARDPRGILLRFREGGVGADQRRAFSAAGLDDDPSELLGRMSGGLITGGAQAILDNSEADAVADWQPGQQIELRCHSAGNSHIALLLDDCQPMASVLADAEKTADKQVDLFFAGKPLDVTPGTGVSAPNELAVMYAYAAIFPDCKFGAAMFKCIASKRLKLSNTADPRVMHMQKLIADLNNPLVTSLQHWPGVPDQFFHPTKADSAR